MIKRTTFFFLGIAVILPASAQSESNGQNRFTASHNQSQQQKAKQNGPAPGIEKDRVDTAKQPEMGRAFVYQNHLKLYQNRSSYARCGTVTHTDFLFDRRSLIQKTHEQLEQSGLMDRSPLSIIESKSNNEVRFNNVSEN